ncbi:MAG TPA: hypothetical protein DCX12_12615 [Chloroflexi bacterium]|nr:hypothetical protein [Chloroflexota bacterium]
MVTIRANMSTPAWFLTPSGWLWIMIARAAVPVASSSAALLLLGPPAASVTVGGSTLRSTATS